MSNRDFGGLVRRSRERLGLSQTRVGELVGRAASTIRAWERGQSVPTDPTAVSSLAAVLGLDEPELFALAGLDPPMVIEEHPTIEQSLREIAPREDPPAPPPSPVQESLLGHEPGSDSTDLDPMSPPEAPPEEPSPGLEVDPEPLPSLDALLASLEAPPPVPVPSGSVLASPPIARQELAGETPSAPGPDQATPVETDPAPTLDATPKAATMIPAGEPATNPVAGPEVRRRDLRSSPTPVPRAAPLLERLRDLSVRWRNRPGRKGPPAPVGIGSAPSYIEIPEQRAAYTKRRVYTAVAVFVFLLLAVWSYRAARIALAETIDLLLSGL